jgi:adenine phosphoribosyltransferase
MELKNYIYVEEDFPRKGISFKDVSPLLEDPEAFRQAIDQMKEIAEKWKPDLFVGPESRGFLFGTPLAIAMGKGFLMARKPGKLPAEVIQKSYTKEYGTDTIEIHKDAITPEDVVVIHDDLLATGGTMYAAYELVKSMNPKKIYINFICDLADLHGRDVFPKDVEITSLFTF